MLSQFAAAIGMASIVGGCAGYHVGTQTLFPAHIRTVHVPVFESELLRRGLGEWLTEAVVKEIESRPGYKVVGRSRADSILEGRLVDYARRVIVEDPFDDPRQYETRMRVQIRWVANNGQVLVPDTTLPIPDALLELQHTADLVPEVGQSVVSNQQQLVEHLAKQIVATMEVPW